MSIRPSLVREVVVMALDTLRVNKMRSGLTILGVVIGITSIVGMTAMVRGFDESLRQSIREIGPSLIFVQRFGLLSFTSGATFNDLIRRPNLSVSDARAIEAQAESIQIVDVQLGVGGAPPTQERVFYRDLRTRPLVVIGTTERFAIGTALDLAAGRFFSGAEVQARSHVAVLGQTPYLALFAASGSDPIGKMVRVGAARYTVVGVFVKRPAVGGFNAGQDDFVVVPYTAYQRQFGLRGVTLGRGANSRVLLPMQIAAVPREGVPQSVAIAEVQQVMRSRHGLRLDDPDDFDLVTQDAILQLWDRISQATFLALIVISSIALMVGGIGVMAIMSISVTERTREIGLRMALGARRLHVLLQFLAEAIFLSVTGGIAGIVMGVVLSLAISNIAGWPAPISLPAILGGFAFSATVGVFFGYYPARKAARLDPIEALRYE